MSQDNSAFGHHLDQISGTQLETQVPPDTKDNNFLIEVSSFEKIKARRGCGHLTIITVHQSVSSFAPEPHGDPLPIESPQLPLGPGRGRTGPQVTDRVLVSQANWELAPSNSAQSQGWNCASILHGLRVESRRD